MSIKIKLKSNIGKTGYLILKSGENPEQIGIRSIDEDRNMLIYMHRNGLNKLQEAQSKNLPEKPILDDPSNFITRHIDEIADFKQLLGDF